MTDKSEKKPDGHIEIPHLNAKIPYWYHPGPTLMDVNPLYVSKEDREKLLKSKAEMYMNYNHAKTRFDK
jgi:hypothetical protein